VGGLNDTAQGDPLDLITVALGDGSGGFGDLIVTDTGRAVGTVDNTYITVAELNNDGYLNVVSGTGRVYLGDGTGALTYSENLPGSEKLFTFDQGPLAVTDFNGDNSADFFGLNQDPFIRNTSPAVALGTGAIDSSGSQSAIITLSPGEVNTTIDSGLIRVMNFEKFVNGEEADDPTQPVSLTIGDAVTYTYSIENTSDFDLGTADNPFSLVDDNGTPNNPDDDLIFSVNGGTVTHEGINDTIDEDGLKDGLLNPGETWTLTAEKQTAVDGLVTNTAKVSIGDTKIATDTASYEVATIAAVIDWKPGSNPSAIKLNRGKVPVAILGSDSFDVTTIDIDTLRADDELTGGGVGINVKNNGRLQYSIEDTNADGFADLVAHFDAVSLGSVVNPNADPFLTDNQIYLFGSTTDGQAFVGTQSADDPIKLLA
jgi:hypothetical protein